MMSVFPSTVLAQGSLPFGASKLIQQNPAQCFFSLVQSSNAAFSGHHQCFPRSLSVAWKGDRRYQNCAASVSNSGAAADSESVSDSKSEMQRKGPSNKSKGSQNELNDGVKPPQTTIPRKPRRGRRSEAVAVEDFVRDSLEKTFASIREQNPEMFVNKEQVLKGGDGKAVSEDDDDEDDYDDSQADKQMVIEEDDPSWPADADVGWGIRASDYFEKHAIKNVVGDDGHEIDWEGEIDDSWVQEINCLEWESFAFHPSPLIVLVFERYNRATENWKLLKELEKALQVYWGAKDQLPPRAVKLDVNIERDLVYALKVRQTPQILFLRGQKLLYRESGMRTADELVHMIAYFYYKAKKPSWIDDAALA